MPDQKGSAWRTWIGSPTAWLALFISAGTAYYNIFYYVDDLRISMDVPGLYIDHTKQEMRVSPPDFATFINAGTRAVAVTTTQIFFSQPIETVNNPDCTSGQFQYALSTAEGLVIEPGDITTVTFEPIEATISVSDWNLKRVDNTYLVIACLVVTLVRADGAGKTVLTPVAEVLARIDAPRGVGAPSRYLFDPDKPIQLEFRRPFSR